MNEIKKFIDEITNKLPFESVGITYIDKVTDFFDTYIRTLDTINSKTKITNNTDYTIRRYKTFTNKFKKQILLILDTYLNGQPQLAYKTLEDLLIRSKISPNYCKNYIDCFTFKISSNTLLYRLCRIESNEITNIPKERIYHIPFNRRDLIKNQRYSMNGYPILYLGSSIENCIKELNIGGNEIVYESKFRYIEKTHIYMDLRIPDDIFSISDDSIMNTLLALPMIAVCSFRVNNPDKSFKEEYILPQLLLQAIRSPYVKDKTSYNGIVYTSTKVTAEERRKSMGNYDNYAIPTNWKRSTLKKTVSHYDLELISRFEITPPKQLKIEH